MDNKIQLAGIPKPKFTLELPDKTSKEYEPFDLSRRINLALSATVPLDSALPDGGKRPLNSAESIEAMKLVLGIQEFSLEEYQAAYIRRELEKAILAYCELKNA